VPQPSAKVTARFPISLPGLHSRSLLYDLPQSGVISLDSALRSEPPAVKLAPCLRLEHIYPKLGVENRTAAASFASELNPRAK
jgi:hypothetical protein